jgi:hypothetical protein
MARLTWVFAVCGLTTSRAAISSLDCPAATRGEHFTLAVGQGGHRTGRRCGLVWLAEESRDERPGRGGGE